MAGGRKPYARGYRFETLVRKRLEEYRYLVERKKGSAFPDLTCFVDPDLWDFDMRDAVGTCFIECKVSKYLSAKEKEAFRQRQKYAKCFVAYPEKNAQDSRKVDVVIANFEDYTEVWRI